MNSDYSKKSIEVHRKSVGKIEISPRIPLKTQDDLSVAYTPGVAAVCEAIHANNEEKYNLTSSKNTVAIVTDGTAVLGLGDIGSEAALPVMEGKVLLMKKFGGIDAFPIALGTTDTEEIIRTIKNIAPTFGGINLEDISAPRCFEIEKRLQEELDIPVFHDDQHGTAIVVLAGLINALKVVGKKKEDIKVVINGAGAAGIAITELLSKFGVSTMYLVDSKGVISDCRDDLNPAKQAMLDCCVAAHICGGLKDTLKDADVFIGVSKGGILGADDIKSMNKGAIVFALANPVPETFPDEAVKGGAGVAATGRSDYPNQLNNVLVFPGIFKGAIEGKIRMFTDEIKIAAAEAIASQVSNPTNKKIIPGPFDTGIASAVADAVRGGA